MSGVYSTRFILAQGLGPFTYGVPSGKRAIIKFASVINGSSSAQQAVLAVAGINCWVASVPVNAAQLQSGLHVVVNAGELMSCITTHALVIIGLHGYLLDA